MQKSKLVTPLFYNGNFNREGHKMRAVFEREISDGTQTYRLWRSAGKPDIEYPRAENDKYILYIEINGYLATLRITDFVLTDNCGFALAAEKIYGGMDKRAAWIDSLRESGGNDAVSAAVAEERKEIERIGYDPARQTAYIRDLLNGHVNNYLKAKENDGQSFPDYIGALVMNELTQCTKLSVAYKAKIQAEADANRVRMAEEEKMYCVAQNKEAEDEISAAIHIICEGGVLKNKTVRFYQTHNHFSDYSIVNYLMRQYRVEVPLRTQGWINRKLCSVTIEDGKCVSLQYRRVKSGRCPQTFFNRINALIHAVATSVSD